MHEAGIAKSKETYLKETQSEDGGWPENVENVQNTGFVGLSYEYLSGRNTYSLPISAPQGVSMLVCSLEIGIRKRVVYDVI